MEPKTVNIELSNSKSNLPPMISKPAIAAESNQIRRNH
jgi:hypothetical protein